MTKQFQTIFPILTWYSGDSSVCLVAGYELEDRGSFLPQGKRFSLLYSVQTGRLMGREGFFSAVNAAGA
jgi:hypothetical protein